MDYDARPMESPPRSADARGAFRSEALLVLLLLFAYGWLFVFFERINNPNELVRIYTARALVEEHSWSFGRRTRAFQDTGPIMRDWGYVNDKALVCDDPDQKPPACEGKLYAAKAPGASALAVPVLAVLRWFGPLQKTSAVFWLRWILVILPSIAFWLLLRRHLLEEGVASEVALAGTLAGALGSLSLTYGQMFAGHQLAALALGAAYLCMFFRERPLWFGFFCGLAVAVEYPSAPAAAILFAAWLLGGKRRLGLIALGALPCILLLAQFHVSGFGAPWRTPYSHLENPGFVRDMGPTFMGFSIPTAERLYGSLFAPFLGLFFWAPWTALALIAPYWLRRNRPGLTACAVISWYLVFQLTQALWRSGWSVGPRYITPLIPFAVIAIAHAARRAPKWWLHTLRGLGAAGVGATALASSVCQGFPLEVMNPLREVVWPLLSHRFVPPNLLQLAGVPGLWSAAPYFAAIAIAIFLLVRRSLVALVIAAAVTIAQWTAPAGAARGAAQFLASSWTSPPPGSEPF